MSSEADSTQRLLHRSSLEAELLEEPLVLAALVSVLEAHSDLEASLLAFDWVFQVLHSVFALETNFWDAVASWHQVVVVDELKVGKDWSEDAHGRKEAAYLDERLDSAILMHLRLVHAARHTTWIAVDASDERLSELLIRRSIVERLHDDGLAASVASAQHEHYFA